MQRPKETLEDPRKLKNALGDPKRDSRGFYETLEDSKILQKPLGYSKDSRRDVRTLEGT